MADAIDNQSLQLDQASLNHCRGSVDAGSMIIIRLSLESIPDQPAFKIFQVI
jgi:hypothetical protein